VKEMQIRWIGKRIFANRTFTCSLHCCLFTYANTKLLTRTPGYRNDRKARRIFKVSMVTFDCALPNCSELKYRTYQNTFIEEDCFLRGCFFVDKTIRSFLQ